MGSGTVSRRLPTAASARVIRFVVPFCPRTLTRDVEGAVKGFQGKTPKP